MNPLDYVAKQFGYQRTGSVLGVDKAFKPWESIPETSAEAIMGELPPPWKAEDYLKACKSWVYACVSAISDEVATIKLKLFQKKGEALEEIFEHPLLDLLYKVNPYTTKFDHWSLTQEYLELTGEAPWLLERDGNGPPTAIYLLRPDKLTIKFEKGKVIGKYIYRTDMANTVDIDPQDIILIRYPNPLTLFRGMGTLEAAAQTVDLEKYAEQWNLFFFYNQARPDAVLTSKKSLTPDQRKRIETMWKKQFQGISKNAKLALLEGDFEYKPMQMSQKDMDFLEQQRFSRDKIFSIFRVPKSIIAISDDVNRAVAETHAYAFARWTIRPKMIRIIEQLNEFLVPMFGDDLVLGFEDPVPENTELKLSKYEKALGSSGWMTINEVRKLEALPEVEGGDVILRPIMEVPVGSTQEPPQTVGAQMKGFVMFPVIKEKKKDKPRLSQELILLNARNRRRIKIDTVKNISEEIRKIVKSHLIKNGDRNKK